MFDLLLSDGMFPFTLSLALLFGLLALEIVFGLLGGTLLGAGADGLDMDGPDMDVDLPDLGDLDIDLDLDGTGIDIGDLELAEPDLDAPDLDGDMPDGAPTGVGSVAAWLGFGKMPALIWLAAILMSFGLSGLVLQVTASNILGGPLPSWMVAAPAGAVAIWFARFFGALFAHLLPKVETEALSERHLGRRTGVVTQGTAARGRPAEVRVTDRYGNTHYLRAEPLRDDAQIPQGTEVMVLRHRYEQGYLLVALS
ncbi:YqiJ family protein [Mameliella alba]|nr:YqiJ family protein [Antarctobacter heliothermus]MBY6142505.1 YqiJ family protein [Mameliella alba]MCA0953770.1 YqiJ family protein [Mameliella alba]